MITGIVEISTSRWLRHMPRYLQVTECTILACNTAFHGVRLRATSRPDILVSVHFVGARAWLRSAGHGHTTHRTQLWQFPFIDTNCVQRSSAWRSRRTARRVMSVKILSTVETSCTTNPQQIAAMELKGYRPSWPTCSKQPRLTDCRIGVVNKLDRRRRRRRRVLLTTRSTCRGEIFEVRSLRQSLRGN